jgi:hypothetical protein
MKCRVALGTAFALLTLAAARTVVADPGIQATFDSVDFVEIRNHDVCSGCTIHTVVTVRGITTGHSTPSTLNFDFGTNKDMATRCERLATIAMSKPGKYQFDIGADTFGGEGGHGVCRLTLVAP